MKLPLVFDTDIGSDVDDAMTLAMLLGSPEVHLVGVTTVYGDTGLRARIASRYLRLAGHPGFAGAVPVIPGSARTLTGRDIWWAGHEGTSMPGLADQAISDGDAVSFLLRTVREVPGLHVVATGPLTNIARAVLADDGFTDRIAGLTVMGGAFDVSHDGRPEHNFASDPEAASIVVRSGLPITVVPLDITQRFKIGEDEITRMTVGGPLGTALGKDVRQWWEHNGNRWNVPHDPVAALALIEPGRFTFEAVDMSVRVDDHPGRATATPNVASVARRAVDVDADAVGASMVRRIEQAVRHSRFVTEP